MDPPSWNRLGHLPPDAPELQRETWALLALRHRHLASLLDELALRTAEPTWAAVLREGAGRSVALAETLVDEAGAAAMETVHADELVGEWRGFLAEVETSGHVPSLIVTAYADLGELGAVPACLLEEVAGPHARPLLSRAVAFEGHRPLKGLLAAVDPGPRDREQLRRLARHCNTLLFGVFRGWRQTFHSLGVDGEWIDEASRQAARTAHHDLGLAWTRADARAFGV